MRGLSRSFTHDASNIVSEVHIKLLYSDVVDGLQASNYV